MNKVFNVIMLVISINFLFGCGGKDRIQTPFENNTHTLVYFCPDENCSMIMGDFLSSANNSIYCAFYDLDLENIMATLIKKNQDKIDVKLFMEKDNFVEIDVDSRADKKSSYMHDKFCIVDEKIVLTGSMNPTVNGATKNNNNIVIIKSKLVSKLYFNEFNELWNYEKDITTKNNIFNLSGSIYEVYFSPEDDISGRITELIDNAQNSIHFMTFSFTHDSIANSILKSSYYNNVSVYGIFEKRNAGSEYSKYDLFEYQGLNVNKDNNPFSMHHKVFIIDKKILITGSFNPSMNAAKKNDENTIIIHDEKIAKLYIKEFNRLFT